MINILPARRESWWRWTGSTNLKVLLIYLRDAFFSRVALEAFDRDPARTELDARLCIRDPLLNQIGHLLLDELEKPGPGGKLFVESLANALTVHLLRDYASDVKAEPKLDYGLPAFRLRRVIDYIEAHLGGAITLEQMAQLAGYSAYHFSRLFKQATKRSPHRYLIDRRVERAKALLKTPGASAAGIAYDVGFSSQSHFATAFKKTVGVTPRAYRVSSY